MPPQVQPHLLKIRPYVPGKPIEAVRRELGLKKILKLASNENPLGPSPKAVAAARKALASVHRYPEGEAPDLRAALAKRWGLKPGHFVFGNGSNEILIFAAQAFSGPKRPAAYSARSFAVYEIAAKLAGAPQRVVPSPDFQHDLPALAKASQGAGLVYVCNPNNPTGSFHSAAAISAFLKKVPRQTLIVLDEAYAEFAGHSMAQDKTWLKQHPNLLICRTFSKLYGLAGLRVGYGVGHPDLIKALELCRQPFNLNLIAQKAAQAALGDKAFEAKTLRLNAEGLKQLSQGLAKLGLWQMPSKANFIFFAEPSQATRSGASCYDDLMHQGVIVRPMGPGYLRVTVGLPKENAAFLNALKRGLA